MLHELFVVGATRTDSDGLPPWIVDPGAGEVALSRTLWEIAQPITEGTGYSG